MISALRALTVAPHYCNTSGLALLDKSALKTVWNHVCLILLASVLLIGKYAYRLNSLTPAQIFLIVCDGLVQILHLATSKINHNL